MKISIDDFATARNLNELSVLINRYLCSVFNAENCVLYGRFYSYSAPFIHPINSGRNIKITSVSFFVGEGLTGRAFKNGKSLYEEYPLKNKSFIGDYDNIFHNDLGALGCYPLKDRKDVIGCLNIYWNKAPKVAVRRKTENAIRKIEPYYILLYMQWEQELLIDMMMDHILLALENKDPYTRGHSDRVSAYAVEVGKKLGLSSDKMDELKMSGYYHDIGKIFIDEKILTKAGPLNDEEWLSIKRHPVFAREFLYKHRRGATLLQSIIAHHEKIDGTGYPYNKSKEEIPLHSQIISVCDVFDAMTSRRVYRKGIKETAAKAIEVLQKGIGKSHSKKVVDVFTDVYNNGRIDLARGQYHAKNGGLRTALKYFKAAKLKAQRNKTREKDDQKFLVDVYYHMGATLNRLGNNIKKAKQTIDKGLVCDPQNPKLLAELAQAYYFSHEIEHAIDIAEKAIKSAYKHEHLNALGKAKQISGLSHSLQNQFEDAKQLLKQAINIFQTIGEDKELAKVYDSYANVLMHDCRFDEAEKFLQYSEEIKIFHQDVTGLAITYGNLGRLCTYQERYQEAISFFNRDLRIASKIPDHRGISLCNAHLGRISITLGLYDEAEKYLQTCLDSSGPPLGRFFTRLNMVDLALAREDNATAKKNLMAAKRILSRNKLTRLTGFIDTYRAKILYNNKKYAAAHKSIERALEFFRSGYYKYELLMVYETAAEICQAEGDVGSALKYLKRLRRLAKKYGLSKVVARIDNRIENCSPK